MNLDSKKVDKLLKYILILLPMLIIYILSLILFKWDLVSNFPNILGVFSPFFISFIIAWLLEPLVDRLHKKGVSRGWATFLVFIVAITTFVLLVGSLIPMLIEQLTNFANYIPVLGDTLEGYLVDLTVYLESIGIDYNFSDLFSEFTKTIQDSQGLISSIISYLSDLTVSTLINFSSVVFNTILILTMSYYLTVDFDRFLLYSGKIIPIRYRSRTLKILREINVSVGGYIKSYLIISFIVFFLSAISFAVLGLKGSLLLALIIGVTNVIPYLGPFIGGVPAVLVGLTESVTTSFIVLLLIILIQQFDALFLKPVLMGKSTQLHPVAIILGIFVFGELFGIMGIVLAIPIVSIIRILLLNLNDKVSFIND